MSEPTVYMVNLTRRQIVRGEIETAIGLFLNNGDAVSCHVLAYAGLPAGAREAIETRDKGKA